jgi:hypothetical protein
MRTIRRGKPDYAAERDHHVEMANLNLVAEKPLGRYRGSVASHRNSVRPDSRCARRFLSAGQGRRDLNG